jgi:hypothetical protein
MPKIHVCFWFMVVNWSINQHSWMDFWLRKTTFMGLDQPIWLVKMLQFTVIFLVSINQPGGKRSSMIINPDFCWSYKSLLLVEI